MDTVLKKAHNTPYERPPNTGLSLVLVLKILSVERLNCRETEKPICGVLNMFLYCLT